MKVGKGVKINEMRTDSSTNLDTAQGAKISKLIVGAETSITGDNVIAKIEKKK